MQRGRHWPSSGRFRWALGVLLLVCARPAYGQPPPLWGELMLPGGAAAAREALALGDAEGRLSSTLLLDFVRRFANTDLRVAAERFDQHVAAAKAAGDTASATRLPLPLPAFWADTLGPTVDLLGPLLRHRGALLMYHGLMGLDDPTLAALAARPALLRAIVEHGTASAAFATFSDGLRIGSTGVETPGGPEFVGVWRALVGVEPSDVDTFTRTLLTRDGGRLAWFYRTVAGLPGPAQRFALASSVEPARRVDAVRAIYHRFSAVDPNWHMDVRPFFKPPFDGALMLQTTRVDDDGVMGPAWWTTAFEGLSAGGDWARSGGRGSGAERAADARWLFDWVLTDADAAVHRFGALRFAQRLFADLPPEAAADVRAAVGGALATPVLMFALERMGVTDVTLLATVARAARAATESGSESRVIDALARWQAALGLLEQVQRRRALPVRQVNALVRTLIDVAPAGQGDAPGAVAAWVINDLLPVLVPEQFAYAAIEDAFLRAATTPVSGTPLALTWEGLPYVVDMPAVTLRSATAIRRARPGPQLQDLAELVEIHRALANGTGADRLTDLGPRLDRLGQVIAREARSDDRRLRALGELAAAAERGAARPNAAVAVVGEVIDAVTETVVPSLLYALAASPTNEPILYPEAWTRHSLRQPPRMPFASSRAWQEVAWQFPTDYGLGGGTRLIGAYLGVDIALADAQLVRLISGTVPVPGVIDDPMRRGVVERLVLAVPADQPDPASMVVATLAAGRLRVAAWRERPDGDAVYDALGDAGVDPWRARALAFETAAGRLEALDTLSLNELVSLGAAEREGATHPVRWSGSSRLIDGCFCMAETRPVTPEHLRGRRLGVRALQPLDITIALADRLSQLGLDATLVPALLRPALQDWLDRSRPAWTDDWEAYTLWPRALPAERVEEYLLFLVSSGVFSPPAPTESER